MEPAETTPALDGKSANGCSEEQKLDEGNKKLETTATNESDSQLSSPEPEPETTKEVKVDLNIATSQNGDDSIEEQSLAPKETQLKNPDERVRNGDEPVKEKMSIQAPTQEWELDKSLPPIKVRREGQSCESSPSDPSPPSPKRMRDIYSKGMGLGTGAVAE